MRAKNDNRVLLDEDVPTWTDIDLLFHIVMADRCVIQRRDQVRRGSVSFVPGTDEEDLKPEAQEEKYWKVMSIESGKPIHSLMEKYVLLLPNADKRHPSQLDHVELDW